jgi:hypothetical protein
MKPHRALSISPIDHESLAEELDLPRDGAEVCPGFLFKSMARFQLIGLGRFMDAPPGDHAALISNSVSSSGLSTMMSWPQPVTPWVRQVGSALHCASHLSNTGCG